MAVSHSALPAGYCDERQFHARLGGTPPNEPREHKMTDLVKRIVEYAPRYVVTFGSLVVDPKSFIEQARKNRANSLNDSLAFFGVSLLFFTICQFPILMTLFDTSFNQIIIYAIGISISFFVAIYLYSIALYISWRLFGWKSSIRCFVNTEAYIFGVVLVASTTVIIVAEGLFAILDPTLYNKAINSMRHSSGNKMSLIEANEIVLVPMSVLFLGSLGIIIWYVMAWGNYRQINNLSEWTSVFVFILSIILSIPTLVLIIALQTMFQKAL